ISFSSKFPFSSNFIINLVLFSIKNYLFRIYGFFDDYNGVDNYL
ncbi:unnamed protein product, partial [marine sediment metagenome]